jgi:hypothetical protein
VELHIAGVDVDGTARLDEPEERARVAGFLHGGEAIVVSPGCSEDRLDPERGEVVPLGFVTDGTWIWSFALEYYVTEHGVTPEPDFYAYIRSRDFVADQPDDAARDRAAEFLRADFDGD